MRPGVYWTDKPMSQPTEATGAQAKVLRVLADQLEQGGAELSSDLMEALERELEDLEDLKVIAARADEPLIPWEQVKAELGL